MIGKNPIDGSQQSFSEFLLELLSDQNLYLLFDRYQEPTVRSRLSFFVRNKERSKSMLQYQQHCVDVALDWKESHSSNKTKYMSFRSAPHTWEKYIGARVAQYLGIRCFVTLQSRVPGYVFIGDYIGRSPELVEVPEDLKESEYDERARNYVYQSTKAYIDVMPDYEAQRLNRNKGRYYSIAGHLRKHWSRPSYVVNSMLCWRKYKSISKPLEDFLSGKYVVVFPHYQPERTSVPEGYGFAQQKLMVLAVREALPKDVHVLVKEHPSTFTNDCQTIGRWPSWYQSINEMEGVDFIDIRTDNFNVIDNAIATATLSGTVANESLLRGVPTVIFGILRWCPTYAQHHFINHQRLSEFLHQAASGAFEPDAIRESTIRTMVDREREYAVKYEPWLDFKAMQEKIIERTIVT
mgnify:CR=1 FL=1